MDTRIWDLSLQGWQIAQGESSALSHSPERVFINDCYQTDTFTA